MRMVDLIARKRDGKILIKQEIEHIIKEYTAGNVPDYQMAAWAMAVYFRGMSSEETASLTQAIALSGDIVDLSQITGVKVDKHSTGGVGDTTTLVVAPLVAAAGIPVAKMSGRGLGHTGGTVDKLESIAGLQTELSIEQFIKNVNCLQVAVIGQSGNLTPADKLLYALRDVTATVDSIPLIASSIMSKKIAAGADAIVLDVKVGNGAFMKTLAEAEALATAMVEIGKQLDRQTIAVISDMNQPLGLMVGNSLEIKEAIATLRGEGPDDLTRLSLTLGAYMLVLGGGTDDFEEAYTKLEKLIQNGEALNKFKQFVSAQNGDATAIDHPDKLPQAAYQIPVTAPASGSIHGIQAEEIGVAASMLGAGRTTKESSIDLAVGIELTKKVGQPVQQGETIAILHANRQDIAVIERKVVRAFEVRPESCTAPQLIHKVVR